MLSRPRHPIHCPSSTALAVCCSAQSKQVSACLDALLSEFIVWVSVGCPVASLRPTTRRLPNQPFYGNAAASTTTTAVAISSANTNTDVYANANINTNSFAKTNTDTNTKTRTNTPTKANTNSTAAPAEADTPRRRGRGRPLGRAFKRRRIAAP